jgi:mannose-1-phosphate guanylyltransferase/mannose-6-phosphate isomerase
LIHPVILCGGTGSRLWPLSREQFPKQFARLTGPLSLFQACVERLTGEGFAPPLVVTGAPFRFVVAEQLDALAVEPAAILIEPEARDTGPAVLAAALRVMALDPEGVMLVAPSDHHIPDGEGFRAAVRAGLPAAARGAIVTFGIAPDRAETGYGYLELEAAPAGPVPVGLRRFVEKPDAAGAAEMVASGRYLWNAGIFLARAADLVAAFAEHAPDLVAPVRAAVEGLRADLGFLRLDPAPWSGARAVSVDYAVMEKAQNLAVVPYAGPWSDLGDWDAIWRASARDAQGVAVAGAATAIGCRDSLLRVEGEGQALVGIGLEDMVVVAMADAVVVAPRARAQEVRAAVARLRSEGRPQAAAFARELRPWGWFETVARGERHQVKRIVVRPGGVLSLQSHVHRAEHWIVVSGTARVTIGETMRLVAENESIYVPLGALHRLENPGKVDLHVIEVQTGAYLGEDDITRYDDVYRRTAAD